LCHEGKLRSSNVPHARVPVTGAKIETGGLVGQIEITHADWQGKRYGYGENIWNLATRYPVETFQNSELRYGADLHLFLIFLGLALVKAPTNTPLTLVVPAPPGIINRVAKIMRDNILAGEDGSGNGTWNITLNGAKKPQTFVVERVITVPEGVPGYAAYRFDIQGDIVPLDSEQGYDYLTGQVRIVDLGFGTADAFDILDGGIAADSIDHATHPELGIATLMLQPLLDEIQRMTRAEHRQPEETNE
jgi:hypothetical protein